MSDSIQVSDLELFNSWLESSWDAIDDLPDFALLPIGLHKIKVTKCEIKDSTKGESKEKTKAIVILAEYQGEIERADGDDTPTPKEGSLCSQRFNGSRGIQTFKKLFGEFLESVPNPAVLIEHLNRGQELLVAVNHQESQDKVDPETGKPVRYANWKTVAAV